MTTLSAPFRPLLGLALLLASSTALAATPIDQTRPLDPGGRVEIENLKGRIDVQAWDRAEVRIEGSLGKGVEKLQIEGDAQRLAVRVKYPSRGGMGLFSGGSSNTGESTELRLMVPRRADLEINSVSADVDVKGLAAGAISIDSVSGAVGVVGAPGKLEVDSVSGNLRLVVNSRHVDLETVSGDIDLRGRLDGEVDVETVSGRIDVAGHESRIHELSGSSVSGDIRIATALAPGGRISLESVSGDIAMDLPADLSANVRAKSFSGKLAAPGADIERPKHGPGSSFSHRYGEGEGEITIETFSGDGRLRLD